MKTIVIHPSVDLDCIAASWIIMRNFPEWDEAKIEYIPYGGLWENVPVDENPNVLYVDVGQGRFDHHQRAEYTSATKLVYEYACEKNYIEGKSVEALARLVALVNEIDHFAEWNYPEAASDRWDLSLFQIMAGLKQKGYKDEKLIDLVFAALDGVLQLLKNKIKAEGEIKQGYVFTSRWGKTLCMNSSNDEAMRLAQKTGYHMVVTKNPEDGGVRIKTVPLQTLDLTPLYERITEKDKTGTWYLHISKHMLLNGSKKKPGFVPSPLILQQLIEIIRSL
jgi:hypothetical protein